MPQINLVWNDSNNQLQSYQLSLLANDLDKKTNIGRDQQRCELWLAHSTVSRVHAEVSFKAEWQRFYLRNLAANNPVRIDGGLLVEGEVALYEGSMIQFGQVLLQVSDVAVDDIFVPVHSASSHNHTPETVIPPISPVPSVPPVPNIHIHGAPRTSPTSGQAAQGVAASQGVQSHNVQPQSAAPKLVCQKCHTLQSLSLRNSNCPVCGHFLADAASQYFF
ncbi:MAG: FHA domain-containing protein [Cyanobacteria bacterium P01_F01_bin.3]